MILVAISFHCSERSVGVGAMPQKIFETTPFQSKENATFDVKRALQRGYFRSFLKRAGIQMPRTP